MFYLLLSLLFSATHSVYALEKQSIYAKIMFDQVYLFKTPSSSLDQQNIYFELPKTYYVELVGEKDNFYIVNYQNFSGYVEKSGVQAVSGTPKTPYLTNINFRVYADLSRDIYELPTTNSATELRLPLYCNNVSFIGKVLGEQVIDNRTNTWFYCKYTLDKDYYGYVYSDFCDQMTSIHDNNEKLQFIDNPSFLDKQKPTGAIPENNNAVGIIIVILTIPSLIFLWFVLKNKHLSFDKTKSKEIIDY